MLHMCMYSMCSKYWDRQAWANSVDPDKTSQNAPPDQGLHCLPINSPVDFRYIDG